MAKDRCAYLGVLVELPDASDVRRVGNLLGDPMQEVQIGKAVEVVWEDHESVTLAPWQVARAG